MASYYLTNALDTTVTSTTAYLARTQQPNRASSFVNSLSSSGTANIVYQTEMYLPSSTSWGTVAFSVVLNVTTGSSNVTATGTIKNSRTGGSASTSAGVTMSAGTKTLSFTSTNFGAALPNDRIYLTITLTNGAMSSQTVTWSVNTASSYISSPITEFNGQTANVVASTAQYKTDYTAVSTGGSLTSGSSIILETDVISRAPGYTTSTSFEKEAVGTSFTNSADFSNRAIEFRTGPLITARRGSVMTYDSINDRYLVLGGYDGTSRYNELWEIDMSEGYGRWHKLAPGGSGPAVFNLGSAIQANANGKSWMVQYGGANSSGAITGGMYVCDCTTPGSETWNTITQTNTPGNSYYNTRHLVAVPTSSTTVDIYLWGGATSSSTFTNALWKTTLNMASSLPTALTWTTVAANGATNAPAARDGAIVDYDPTNNRILVVGGYNNTTYFTDATQYSISGAAWSSLTTSGDTFVGRELPSGGYDPVNNRMIVFGGWQGTSATTRNDIFSFDMSGSGTAVIHQLRANDTTNQDFVAHGVAASCVDTKRGLIIDFGQNSTDTTDKYVYAFNYNDTASTNTFLYGLNIQDTIRGGDARTGVWNPDLGHFVAINGYTAIDDDLIANVGNGDHHNQIWTYNPTSNQLRYANATPIGMTPKEGVTAVYDTTGDRIIAFGGLTAGSQYNNEVWELKADAFGNYHARHMAPSGTRPSGRWLVAAAYDATNNRVVYFGGQDSSAVKGDMWQLDLSSGDGTWSSLSPTGTAPTAVWQPGYAYDATNNRLYVHGGCTNTGDTTYSSQLFYISLSTTTPSYTILTSTSGTAARGLNMAVDVTNSKLWVFGGFTGGTTVVASTRYVSTAGGTWTTPSLAAQPPARRSAPYCWDGTSMYIGMGRQGSGQFFDDLWRFVPNNTTPTSSVWVNQAPDIVQRMQFTKASLSDASYHWQSWAVT